VRDVSVPVRLLFRVPDDVTDEQVAEMVGTCLEWSTARDAFDTACGSTFPGDDLDVDESPGYDGHPDGGATLASVYQRLGAG